MGYAAALAQQESLHAKRIANEIPDTVLLVEHTPVITFGRSGKAEHLLAAEHDLKRLGVEVFESGRGGDVTYHGIGQLVVYPIVDLNPDRRDVRKYVTGLEEVMIRVARDFGITATRFAGFNGAWMRDENGDRKIGAVGVRISRWVTMHGFALNVDPNFAHFDLIVPCGIQGKGVTSLQRETNFTPPMRDVRASVLERFAEVFESALIP